MMHNKLKRLLSRTCWLVVAGLALSGICSAAQYSSPAAGPEPKVVPDQALVVFLRHSKVAPSAPVIVFDISNGGEILIGMPKTGEKSAYYCEPGKRLFMVEGGQNGFLEANLEAGRVYYVLLISVESFRVMHEMRPYKKDAENPDYLLGSAEFKKWNAECKWVVPSDAGRKLLDKNRKSVFHWKEKHLNNWNSITGPVKKYRSLEPQDGLTE